MDIVQARKKKKMGEVERGEKILAQRNDSGLSRTGAFRCDKWIGCTGGGRDTLRHRVAAPGTAPSIGQQSRRACLPPFTLCLFSTSTQIHVIPELASTSRYDGQPRVALLYVLKRIVPPSRQFRSRIPLDAAAPTVIASSRTPPLTWAAPLRTLRPAPVITVTVTVRGPLSSLRMSAMSALRVCVLCSPRVHYPACRRLHSLPLHRRGRLRSPGCVAL
ncbi:hypothetical protein C8R44DRAFT_882410 [Mycena epipterygia]|nr:hypothetical protein C8R44DRAFT_882410 [Mycena epipterygia]